MMAVENAPAIAAALVDRAAATPTTPVAVVCEGTMPAERTVLATLGTLGERDRGERRPAARDHRGRRGGARWPTPSASGAADG